MCVWVCVCCVTERKVRRGRRRRRKRASYGLDSGIIICSLYNFILCVHIRKVCIAASSYKYTHKHTYVCLHYQLDVGVLFWMLNFYSSSGVVSSFIFRFPGLRNMDLNLFSRREATSTDFFVHSSVCPILQLAREGPNAPHSTCFFQTSLINVTWYALK